MERCGCAITSQVGDTRSQSDARLRGDGASTSFGLNPVQFNSTAAQASKAQTICHHKQCMRAQIALHPSFSTSFASLESVRRQQHDASGCLRSQLVHDPLQPRSPTAPTHQACCPQQENLERMSTAERLCSSTSHSPFKQHDPRSTRVLTAHSSACRHLGIQAIGPSEVSPIRLPAFGRLFLSSSSQPCFSQASARSC